MSEHGFLGARLAVILTELGLAGFFWDVVMEVGLSELEFIGFVQFLGFSNDK